jgi:hydantoinase/carbamoylase family amidase
LSAREEEALALAATWMDEAGLEVSRDDIGNVFGRLRGTDPVLAEVWCGSHLDTVPQGGRFDGALGVVGALEAVSSLTAGRRAARTVAVVAFRDEEGSRFGRGCFGSRALCGRLEDDELDACDADGVSVTGALLSLGYDPPPPAGWLRPQPGAFIELHIEQGPTLAAASAPLGVVTAIAGLSRTIVRFTGAAGHAGTVPMLLRDDALCKAAEFVVAVRGLAERRPGAVATVGHVSVRPNAPNVIPAAVELTVDARAPDNALLAELISDLRAAASKADSFEVLRRTSAIQLAPTVIDALRRAIAERDLPQAELPSGAGHDAAVLSAAGIPTGMLFVRSLADGVSHSPDEYSAPGDIGLAIDVLGDVLRQLSQDVATGASSL